MRKSFRFVSFLVRNEKVVSFVSEKVVSFRFVSKVSRFDCITTWLKEEVLEMAVVKPLFTPTGTKFRCFEVSTNLVFRLDLFDLLAKGCIFVCNKKLVS